MTDPHGIDAKLSAWWESIPGQRLRVKIVRLERENAELRAVVERLKAPVSAREWNWFERGWSYRTRERVGELISNRAAKPGGTDAG